jgi:hypothetical protein
VSRKTIAFTMPTAGRRPRKSAPVVLDGLTGDTVPFTAADEQNLHDAGSDPKSDQWVRDNALDAGPSRIPDPPPKALAPGASMTIDLSAERSLTEAMALSVMLPFTLGWFWWAHAITRRQRLWGA